jgi:hypothetical protein
VFLLGIAAVFEGLCLEAQRKSSVSIPSEAIHNQVSLESRFHQLLQAKSKGD